MLYLQADVASFILRILVTFDESDPRPLLIIPRLERHFPGISRLEIKKEAILYVN